MMTIITGRCRTGKPRYAIHRGYLSYLNSGIRPVLMSFESPLNKFSEIVDGIYKDGDDSPFEYIDVSRVTCETLPELVSSLSNDVIVIDSFSFIEMDALGAMSCLRKLNLIDKTIYLTVHVVKDLISGDYIPVPRYINQETTMHVVESNRMNYESAIAWFRVGSVDFVVDTKTQQITEWYDI